MASLRLPPALEPYRGQSEPPVLPKVITSDRCKVKREGERNG